MGQPSINEIEAGLLEWELLKKLPQEVETFTLVPGTGVNGQILNIAAYVNEAMHCRLDITYTSETFDYIPVKTVGLHAFRDERYYARDREHFMQQLLSGLPQILQSISRDVVHKMDYEAKALHFEKWDYWRTLPQRIGDYELFITPDNPLSYINGSFVFLDYTDFKHGNQLYFSYNIFRNEIFAEMKQHHLPLTTDLFNVPITLADDRKLDKLTELMEKHLHEMLEELQK